MPAKRKDITKELLEDLYWGQGLSTYQIAKILKSSPSNMRNYFEAFNIPRRHSSWHGGYTIKLGYTFIWKPDHLHADGKGYVQEHIIIMETHLGRPLTKEEEVHHLNEIKTDNRIENLVLCANHSEHIRLYHPRKKNPATGRFT